jgi:hypothetical protein
MKQTAVEWLVSELMEKDLLLVFGNPSVDNDAIKIIEQAKKMEKKQMIDFAFAFSKDYTTAKEMRDYYNETFKKK